MQTRRSGRTTATLERLPDGGLFIVHDSRMGFYVRSLLRDMGRDPASVRVMSADEAATYLDGRHRGSPVAFDHMVYETTPPHVFNKLVAATDALKLRHAPVPPPPLSGPHTRLWRALLAFWRGRGRCKV